MDMHDSDRSPIPWNPHSSDARILRITLTYEVTIKDRTYVASWGQELGEGGWGGREVG